MAFGVQSNIRKVLKDNSVALAKAARHSDIPTTITIVETDSFSGPTSPELLNVFPRSPIAGKSLDELVGGPEGPSLNYSRS